MSIARLVAIAAALVLSAPSARAADLASARALYAAASYEEALTMLASIENTESLEQVNQIRALCQLALGRTDDAREAIQAIVMHNPLYQIESNDVSPKLVALFHEVRQQTMPAAARALYARAKSRYDAKEWRQASVQFTALLTLLADKDAAEPRAALSDLRQLGEGFLALARTEIAADERRAEEARKADEARRAEEEREAAQAAAAAEAARKESEVAATPSPPARAPSTGGAGLAPTSATRIYSVDDRDVTPPVELSRAMPRWVPPSAAIAAMTLSGLVELVIDEAGAVAAVSIVKPIAPRYDQALSALARSWRYRPAMRSGQPVRYRQLLEIVLRPAP